MPDSSSRAMISTAGEGIDLVVRTFIVNVLIGLLPGILLYIAVGHVRDAGRRWK